MVQALRYSVEERQSAALLTNGVEILKHAMTESRLVDFALRVISCRVHELLRRNMYVQSKKP
jgi:hypothetical protein